MFKFLKNRSNQDTPFDESDIALLAFMCMACKPLVIKRKIMARSYAYYIPDGEEYLYVAQDLFKKNGIQPKVYFSYIVNVSGQYVLRVDYRRSKNCERDSEFFEKIKAKKREMFYGDMKDEEMRLAQMAQQLVNQCIKR